MIELKVNDMHCNGCVSRIDKAFSEAGIAHNIDLDTHKVTIEDDSMLDNAMEELDDLGFEEITKL